MQNIIGDHIMMHRQFISKMEYNSDILYMSINFVLKDLYYLVYSAALIHIFIYLSLCVDAPGVAVLN